MGLILDSSILIAAERKGLNARLALEAIAHYAPGEDIGISVITLAEMAHGVIRANSDTRRLARRQFLQEIASAVLVYPITASIALRAGELDGTNTLGGIRLPLADLLIGVTALELGFRVATKNVRHFRMVPGLDILTF